MTQPPETVQKDLSPDAVVAAIEANAVASVRSWAAWPELELFETPTLLCTLTDLEFPLFNCALRPRLSADTADRAIDESLERAAARQVPLTWWPGALPTPADLEDRLEARGLRQVDEMMGMAVDLRQLAPPPTVPAGMRITEVTDPALLRRWCFVLGPVFDFPPHALAAWRRCYEAVGYGPGQPWRHFLALLDGAPVAAASLFCAAGVAALVNVGTVVDLRGRGIGRSLSAYPLTLARDAGYRLSTLWASPQGAPMYRRLGFRPFCRSPVYLWSQSGSAT